MPVLSFLENVCIIENEWHSIKYKEFEIHIEEVHL